MRKIFLLAVSSLFIMGTVVLAGCGGKGDKDGEKSDSTEVATSDIPMKSFTASGPGFSHTYNVADIDDQAAIYKATVDKSKCFFVLSKKEYRLYVYEAAGQDTALVASFPICYAKNPEAKGGDNDMKTPECDMSAPFSILEIVDASTWCHDFGDGRGMVLAYGAWFMRLDLSQSKNPPIVQRNHSIGIHGSTSNVQSVPGRDSEGCIRLRDADLLKLHDNYAQVGTKVVIKGIHQDKLPFEVKAEKALGDKYKSAKPGNPVFKTQQQPSSGAVQAAPQAENQGQMSPSTSAQEPTSGAMQPAGGMSPAKQ